MNTTIKHSKIHSKYEPRVIGSHVPWLSLSGLWLEKAGFGIGSSIEIQIQAGELRIKPLNPWK